MSWLSGLTNSIGSIFGADKLGDQVSDFLVGPEGFFGADDKWSTSNFLGGLINAGTGLAGSYYGQSASKDLAEQYAESQMNQIAAEKELTDKKLQGALDIAKIQAGASAGAARRNTLAQMYNNWANLRARGGEAQAQQASQTGRGMADPITTRASILR